MSLYRFDDYLLDPQARRLLRGGDEVPVEPRVFDLIVYLIEQRQRAIGRDELIAAAWGRVDSSDATLAQAILKARRLFGDDGTMQRTIRTVARFGYQWVAATRAVGADTAVAIIDHDVGAGLHASATRADAPVEGIPAPAPIELRNTPWRRSARVLIPGLVCVLVIGAVSWVARRDRPSSSTAATTSPRIVPGLILVAPARVHSAVAQDGWMRLGLMSMSADALRGVPGHSIVPNETVLAATGTSADVPSATRLRTATGAAVVVLIDARRADEHWQLDATLLAADGTQQVVSAQDSDAVAAAALLSDRLRGAFDRGAHAEVGAPTEVLATAARMQAAILEGHADHALAVADAAGAVSAHPDIIVLRAKAMNRLGRAGEAVTGLNALIVQAARKPQPTWLSAAYTTLGYSELLGGRFGAAEQAFRSGMAAAGNDRTETGRAWRGLGNAQATNSAFDDAETSYLRARLELGADGDRLLLAHIDDDLGSVAARRGRLEEAVGHYLQAATAAAEIGASELELGARMNVARARTEQLRHAEALASWRELLPRLHAMAYPSMQRYAAVHYAAALAETGAFVEAHSQLSQFVSAPMRAPPGALDDVRLDALRVRFMLGDFDAARAEARDLAVPSAAAAARLDALTVLLRADLAVGDDTAAHADADLLSRLDAGAERSLHVQALTALAHKEASAGADALAETDYRDALALVRNLGSPRELREVALPYAQFLLARGRIDAAHSTAALIQPYAEEDFAITLLLARLAAERDPALSQQLYARARSLAGARSLPPDPSRSLPALAAASVKHDDESHNR